MIPAIDPPVGGVIAHNLRRIMAQSAMTYDDVVEATGLDSRTIRAVIRSDKSPRSATLHKLATGLGITTDELFTPPAGMTAAEFDLATNPMVRQLQQSHPELVAGWSTEDFAQLASHFGVGGELTEQGAVEEARRMNANREVLSQARVILETTHANLLSEFVELLYERVTVDR